ncbi:MAG: response regulator [Geobacteraceae bacterium]|nr:response regulator [Geobacteraceae bacterium]
MRPVILVVDDLPENVQVLGELLSINYEIYFALDGSQALEHAGKVKPDLILLDVMMPVMNGYEVCRSLKESEELRDIPVIFITALDQPEHESQGLELGAVDYITKPFNSKLVLLRVHNHLMMKFQHDQLLARAIELEDAMAKIKILSGIIPICSSCKKIRDDAGYWQQVEEYISKYSEAVFSHGICNDCAKKLYPDYYDSIKRQPIE